MAGGDEDQAKHGHIGIGVSKAMNLCVNSESVAVDLESFV